MRRGKSGGYLPSLPVALRYLLMRWLKGNSDVVAPISAPMLQTVAIPITSKTKKYKKSYQSS